MDSTQETYNPWSIVNLVFRHLADEGLHPVLGEAGDPGAPAAALLRALGITPSTEGNKKVTLRVNDELARLRENYESEHSVSGELRTVVLGGGKQSQAEITRGHDPLCDPEHRPF
jgi:hypothetical protein